MSIRILTSEQDALDLIASIEILENIPRPGTITWGEPIVHPDGTKWAVILSDLSTPLPDDLHTLPPGWYATSEGQ